MPAPNRQLTVSKYILQRDASHELSRVLQTRERASRSHFGLSDTD
jgi:hypothetical protein